MFKKPVRGRHEKIGAGIQKLIFLALSPLRQDLNPIEEADALKRLMDDHPYMQEDLARIIGKFPTTISEAIAGASNPINNLA